MASRLPLSALLSQALAALTEEFERGRAGTDPLPSLSVWSNILQYLEEKGIDQRRLPEVAHLSKRAIRASVGSLERKGYVTVRADPSDSRVKMVRLTALGRGARDALRPMSGVVEKRWSRRFGVDEIRRLRGTLEGLVRQFEFELSHYPAGYGPADERITGGNGQDWSTTPRKAGGNLSRLPLSALLSQALVAFSIDYEREAGIALPQSANVLRVLREGKQRAKDLQALGITGAGKSLLERHGYVVVKTTPADSKTKLVRLTWLGKLAQKNYRPLVNKVEREWRTRYGPDTIETLRASLERIVGRLDGDLPHHLPMHV